VAWPAAGYQYIVTVVFLLVFSANIFVRCMASIAGIRVCWQNQSSALLPLCKIAPWMQPMLRASAACLAHAAMFAWHLVRLATCLANWMLSTRRMTTGGEPVERFPMPSVRRVASELKSAAPAVRDMAMRVWCVSPHALTGVRGSLLMPSRACNQLARRYLALSLPS